VLELEPPTTLIAFESCQGLNVLDTLRVKGGLVNALRDHCGDGTKRCRMEVAPLLFCDLVCEENA